MSMAAVRLPYDGSWEGTIRNFSYAIETPCNQLLMFAITKLQCYKQSIGDVLHHFLRIQLRARISPCEDIGSDVLYLRLGWGTNPSSPSHSAEAKSSNSMNFAILERREYCLHFGTSNIIDATYLPEDQTLSLKNLVTFFRICCDELDQEGLATEAGWLFCCIVIEQITGKYPENIDIKEQKNANRIRRHVRIKYHMESGQPLELLTHADQLEYVFLNTKGQSAIGTKESALQLLNLGNTISKTSSAERKPIACLITTRHSTLSTQEAPPPKLLVRVRAKQPLLTIALSETLHDVLQNGAKITIFREVSKRFYDESTMRGLARLRGANVTADFADLGWKLVKYRLYLPSGDAALLMRGVERLARQLVEKDPSIYQKGLLHETLTAYGEELGGPLASVTKEPHTKKRDVFGDAVTVARLLNDAEPGAHLDSLADSLGSYCLALVELGEYEKACEACRESIEMWRILYKQQFTELKEMGCEGGMQQVFREWCWCYCTDDEACEAVTELLLIADSVLNDTSPVEVTDWPTMFSRYGAFLTAAAAAPEGCRTVRMGRPQV